MNYRRIHEFLVLWGNHNPGTLNVISSVTSLISSMLFLSFSGLAKKMGIGIPGRHFESTTPSFRQDDTSEFA